MKREEGDRPARSPRGVIITAVAGVLLVAVVWVATWAGLHGDRAGRGTWGDMFGGASALFSGLAFVGLVVAILLQSHELSLQREELSTQRKELERQNETMARQLFERRFVALVRLLRESVASIRWVDRVSSLSGPAAIEKAARRVAYDSRGPRLRPRDLEKGFRCLDPHPISHALTGYFSSCTEILRWLDELPPEDGRRYRDMFTTTLSQPELWLLLMFAVTDSGATLREFALKYSIFEGLQGPDEYRRLAERLSLNYETSAQEERNL